MIDGEQIGETNAAEASHWVPTSGGLKATLTAGGVFGIGYVSIDNAVVDPGSHIVEVVTGGT